MGLLPTEDTKVQDVNFFKIDESTYDPKTKIWGTDQLIADNSTRTVTIPSDIKPGMYVIRHEIIGLHFAWHENKEKKTSGAQLYPVCLSKWLKVEKGAANRSQRYKLPDREPPLLRAASSPGPTTGATPAS
jgi:hypothetical protein